MWKKLFATYIIGNMFITPKYIIFFYKSAKKKIQIF